MPTENNKVIGRVVEHTAYSRWNKVFQKNSKLQPCVSTAIKVSDDKFPFKPQPKEYIVESFSQDDELILNRSKNKSYRDLKGIVRETMQLYGQFDP